ncbi:hypothetical protein BLNAU_535 [Blattamonas nauphoetae]|uniref:Uncharacterized protein n=1 Tax=Blattamonas nauphoetae TaxID=2049346 RepID=A0ABQ9YLI4_9EUKA|nr:hypothetical protein BLNAU_535 [Blattamonas nauphoetae]
MSMSLFLTQSLEVLWNVQTDKNCSGMIKHQNIEVPLSVYPEMEPINFLPKHTGFYNFTITSKNDPISFQQNLSISTPNYHNIGRHLRIRSSLAQNSPLIVVGVPGNATYCEFTVLDSPLKHVSIVLLSCLPTIVLVVVILLIPAFYSVATFSFYQCYYPCCVPPLVFQQSLQLMEQRKEVEFQERHPPSQRCPCSRRKRKVLSAEQMLNLMYEDNENSMEPLLDFSEDEEDHSEQLSMQDISTRTDNEEETDGHL